MNQLTTEIFHPRRSAPPPPGVSKVIKNSSDPNVGNLRAEVESHQNYPRKLKIDCKWLRQHNKSVTKLYFVRNG